MSDYTYDNQNIKKFVFHGVVLKYVIQNQTKKESP
jgi:acetate kinase